MAYFNFSIDDLQDSSTLASAIANNIVPKNGINILATSTASRGYSGQTLTTSDLISSASGKDLLASGVYGNMYRTNMASISLNSLATSALGSENDDMSILDPSNLNEDGSPKIIKGKEAGLRIVAGSQLGRKYNEGLIDGFSDILKSAYIAAVDGSGHSDVSSGSDSGAVSAGYMPIALESKLSEVEKAAYVARGNLLKSSAVITPSSSLINGFTFDINNSLTNLTYDSSTIFPGVEGSGSGSIPIPDDIIAAKSQRAYISAALIECLLFLSSDRAGSPLMIRGGFGEDTGSNSSRQGDNRSEAVSNNSITDHAFGRAFDFDIIVKKDSENPVSLASSQEEYKKQFDNLIEKLNSAPQHLLPDVILVNNWVGVEYENLGHKGKISRIPQLAENLKSVKVHLVDSHKDHIHMAFAPTRGGIYIDKEGSLSLTVNIITTNTGSSGASGSQKDDSTIITINQNRLTKSYTDNTRLTDIEVFTLLKDYGNFSPQISAMLTAISFRESSWRPHALNKFGFYGLFQVGTRSPGDGSLLDVDLSAPQAETIKNWKLALSDLATKSLTDKQIYDTITERGKSDGLLELYASFDSRAWIPANQVRLLRSKINQKNYAKQISSVGTKASLPNPNYLFNPWGELFLYNGWMSSVQFSIAKIVYIKAGYDADELKDWVLKTTPKDSVAWYKFADEEHSDKTKVEAWVNEEVILGEQYGLWKNGIFTPSRDATSADKWLK